MSGESLPPRIGMKKETKLVIGGFVSPRQLYRLQYIPQFPEISPFTPMDPFELIRPLNRAELDANQEIQQSPGWYFALEEGETPFQNYYLQKLQNYCRNLFAFLNRHYPFYYQGSKMRWEIGSLDTMSLRSDGTLRIDVDDVYKHKDLFQQGMSAFEDTEVFPEDINAELRPKYRTQYRTSLIENNIKEAVKEMRYNPSHIEKVINQLVNTKGISRNDAFRQMAQAYRENENVGHTEGVGQAYGPWLNGYVQPEEEVEEANNLVYNGGSQVINARVKKNTVAKAPPVPVQPAKPAVIPAPWRLENNAQKRKRLANAANKRKQTANNKNKKGGKRRTRRTL